MAGNWEAQRKPTSRRRRTKARVGYSNARFLFLFLFGFFLAPSRLQTVFYASWRLCGGEPGSEAETLADSFSRPWGGPGEHRREGLRSSLGGQGSRVKGTV